MRRAGGTLLAALVAVAACSPLRMDRTEFAAFTAPPPAAAECLQRKLTESDEAIQFRLRQWPNGEIDLAIADGEETFGLIHLAQKGAETFADLSVWKEHAKAAALETQFKAVLSACQGTARPSPYLFPVPPDFLPSPADLMPSIFRGNAAP